MPWRMRRSWPSEGPREEYGDRGRKGHKSFEMGKGGHDAPRGKWSIVSLVGQIVTLSSNLSFC